MDFQQFERKLIKDLSVKATELFDRNFEKQGFFGKKWQPRKNNIDPKRAILMGKGRLRGSLKTPKISGNNIKWNLSVPYAKIHNEGGVINCIQHVRGHNRKGKGKVQTVKSFNRVVNIKIPQRQFIGDSQELRNELKRVVNINFQKVATELIFKEIYSKTPFNK